MCAGVSVFVRSQFSLESMGEKMRLAMIVQEKGAGWSSQRQRQKHEGVSVCVRVGGVRVCVYAL